MSSLHPQWICINRGFRLNTLNVMKYSIRVRTDDLNPFVLLISVVATDLLVLTVFLMQLQTGIVFLLPSLLLILIWTPLAAIIYLFSLFAIFGLFSNCKQRNAPLRIHHFYKTNKTMVSQRYW